MATLNINGRRVTVDDSFLQMSPEQQNATVEEIAASLPDLGQESEASQQTRESLARMTKGMDGTIDSVADERFKRLPEWKKPLVAASDLVDVYGNGITMGFGNKGAAALRSAFTDKSYAEELAAMKDKTQAARDRAGGAGTAAEIAGAVTGPIGLARRGGTLVGRFGTGTMEGVKGVLARAGLMGAEGAAYGGLSAAGNDTDVGTGVALGAALGAALPVATAVGGRLLKPVADAVKARVNPAGYATEKVAERLSNSMTPQQAANRMAANPGTSLADVGGKSTRDLLRTATNIPGKAKDAVASKLTLRQMGQGDRIKDIVRDTFADPDGFITAGEKLSKQWAAVSDDVYAPALARKVVWTDRLKQFVDEPVFQKGLAQGVKIQRLESLAEGKPFNPVDYAITGFNEAGDPIIGGVPNMRTLNVVKKGLDAMIGESRHPLTGKLTEEGRALDMVRRSFLGEIDSWNPDYKNARGVWGGFAKVKEAMLFGQNDALTMSPEAVKKSFKEMSTAERQAARIGIADSIRKKVDAAGFGHNAVLRVFGNRQSVGVLREAFPDAKSFSEFRKAIFSEARKRATYEAVKGNSTTAAQMADMAEAGGLRESFDLVTGAVQGRPVSATLQWVGSRLRVLGGLTPEVADNIARQLMTTSPQATAQITSELARIGQAQLSAAQRQQAVQALITRSLAVGGGTALAQPQ